MEAIFTCTEIAALTIPKVFYLDICLCADILIESVNNMRLSRQSVAIILTITAMMIFAAIAKHLNNRQILLLGFSWLIVATCIVTFNLIKEARIDRKSSLQNLGNAAQVVGFLGAAFGYYYANQHPHLFTGYGIFLMSWLVLAYFLYTKLKKKGYRLLKRRVRPNNKDVD